MQKIFVGLLVAALAAVAAPVNASSSTFEKNLDYFTNLAGDVDMNAIAMFTDGRTMTVGAALADAAARAGEVDLTNIVNGAAPGGAHLGDVWVIEIGAGDCVANVIAATPVPATALHGQLWTYVGGVGTLSTSDGSSGTSIIGWTTKTSEFAAGAGFTATGQQDFYCFSFSGLHLAFPYVDGTASMN